MKQSIAIIITVFLISCTANAQQSQSKKAGLTRSHITFGGGTTSIDRQLKSTAMLADGFTVFGGFFIAAGKIKDVTWGLGGNVSFSKLKNDITLPSSVSALQYYDLNGNKYTATPHYSDLKGLTELRMIAGPSLIIPLGRFYISPSLQAGYMSVSQKRFVVSDTIKPTSNSAENKIISIFSSEDGISSGLVIQPGFKIGYAISNTLSLFGSADYSFGPAVKSSYKIFEPAGQPGADGVYQSDQLVNGTCCSDVQETARWRSLNMNVGVSITVKRNTTVAASASVPANKEKKYTGPVKAHDSPTPQTLRTSQPPDSAKSKSVFKGPVKVSASQSGQTLRQGEISGVIVGIDKNDQGKITEDGPGITRDFYQKGVSAVFAEGDKVIYRLITLPNSKTIVAGVRRPH